MNTLEIFSTLFLVDTIMCVNIYLNGYGSCIGTHVTVYARLLEGSYDVSRSWPFLGTVTHLSMTRTVNLDIVMTLMNIPNSSLTLHSFMIQSTTQYLKNDTLYFRVSVQVRDSKPWLTCTND